jgi:dihydropteroate synthase
MSDVSAPAPVWHVRGRVIVLDRPIIFGIINVTPDSFSDGGRFFSPESAVGQAGRLLEEGADGLDVGGESTRPQGAVEVDAAEELRRVLPVVRKLRRRHPDALLSLDTVKAGVAAAGLAEGVDIVNDVSGFRLDPGMARACSEAGAGVVLMHSRGGVSDMATYRYAEYGGDVTGEVIGELRAALRRAEEGGVAAPAVALDPGIGFAKRSVHSLRVLGELDRVVALGLPVMVGVSRKRFIGEITGVSVPSERVSGSVGANVMALARGARLFRVHDVRPTRHALDVAWAVARAGSLP